MARSWSCRRCQQLETDGRGWNYTDYAIVNLKLKLVPRRDGGRPDLRVTCPKGHVKITQSHQAWRYIDKLQKEAKHEAAP